MRYFSIAVGRKDADKLAELAISNKNLSLFISTNAHTLPDTVGYSAVGEWKGSEFPDQYVTVGGHLDSRDPAEGAQADGAGTSLNIPSASYFLQMKKIWAAEL